MKFNSVIIILIGILFSSMLFSVFYDETRKTKCNALGGLYIRNQCFKAEVIKID